MRGAGNSWLGTIGVCEWLAAGHPGRVVTAHAQVGISLEPGQLGLGTLVGDVTGTAVNAIPPVGGIHGRHGHLECFFRERRERDFVLAEDKGWVDGNQSNHSSTGNDKAQVGFHVLFLLGLFQQQHASNRM
jgi:hypothetical protein